MLSACDGARWVFRLTYGQWHRVPSDASSFFSSSIMASGGRAISRKQVYAWNASDRQNRQQKRPGLRVAPSFVFPSPCWPFLFQAGRPYGPNLSICGRPARFFYAGLNSNVSIRAPGPSLLRRATVEPGVPHQLPKARLSYASAN